MQAEMMIISLDPDVRRILTWPLAHPITSKASVQNRNIQSQRAGRDSDLNRSELIRESAAAFGRYLPLTTGSKRPIAVIERSRLDYRSFS